MIIKQIRNATLIIEYNNTKILIDPWLGPKDYMPGFDTAVNSNVNQPRVELPSPVDEIVKNIDTVIVTHVHPDHWDEYAERALDKNIKIFIQSEDDKKFMQSKGFHNVEILSPDGIEYNGFKMFKTPAQHGKREIIEPLCRQIGMPYASMGVVFKSDNEKTLYLAGDTIWCQEVEDTLNKFKPEIIIINACGATVLNGERLIMDINDVNELLQKTQDSTIIASHMDTVSHLTVTRNDLKNFVKTNNIKNLLIPEDGESISF